MTEQHATLLFESIILPYVKYQINYFYELITKKFIILNILLTLIILADYRVHK